MSHGRRSFLKAGATLSASFLAAPAFGVNPASGKHNSQRNTQRQQSKRQNPHLVNWQAQPKSKLRDWSRLYGHELAPHFYTRPPADDCIAEKSIRHGRQFF